MSLPTAELLELCGAVRDEIATPEQIARLEALLAGDADARRFYRQFTQISAMLERYEQVPAQTRRLVRGRTPRRLPRRTHYWLALAAGIALLAALYVKFRPVTADEPVVAATSPQAGPVALVEDSHHCTVIPRVGPAVALNQSYALKEGDIVATAPNGNAVLRFASENTLFIFSPDTRAWLSREGATKIVHLSSGQVYGDVAPQRNGEHWRILTADGEAKVIGTQLAVTAETSGTRVAVTSGLVRVTARDSRKTIETPAGFAAELTPTTARLIKLDAAQPTRIASFALLDADTNRPIAAFAQLKDGDVIDLAALPTRRINIQANCEPRLVGVVRFALQAVDGAGNALQVPPPPDAIPRAGFPNAIELYYPYMFAGDPSVEGQPLPDHSFAWTPPVGHYTLTATPYAAMKEWGAKGEPLTVHFEIVDSARRP